MKINLKKFYAGDKVKVTFGNGTVKFGTVRFFDKKWSDYAVDFDDGNALMVSANNMDSAD